MTTVTIEYCEPCGLRDPAVETQESLLAAFGRELDGVRLQPGHGGIFQVSADDELVWDRNDHGGEIDADAIVDAVRERTGVGGGE